MIECGWCGAATAAAHCTACGRNRTLPWTQRAQEPPKVKERGEGRPTLDPGQVRQRLRLAYKELGADVTNAALAEYLQISPSTLSRWQKMTSSRSVTAAAAEAG
jgi:hypothetical protein